jgi:SAM-dependent methyltransferase
MLEIRHESMNSTQETQDAYNLTYRGEGIRHRDSFYLWLIGLLHPQPGKMLLDISTGEGRLVTLAQQLGLHTIGTDFAFEGVRIGQSESPHSGWFVGDGEQLALKDSCADYITHIGSLEHYQDPGRGASEIARLLKPGGTACILLPNAFGLLGNIKHVLFTGDIFDDGQPLQRYGTPNCWGKILQDGGLRINKMLCWSETERPRTRADLIWMLKKPKKMLRLLLSPLVPVQLSNHLVYLCNRG